MQNSSMDIDEPAIVTDLHKARILIVDDNPSTAMTLARAVARISPRLDVISATDGEMALEQVKGESVDLVITDMMMPGMNGLELIEKLRLHPAGGPTYTILITAYDVPGLKESARRVKVNETMIKPIHPERICQVVRKALEEMEPAQSAGQSQEARPAFKLLVADDNPSNMVLLTRYLQGEGYDLVTACDGVETLEVMRAEMPDLLLLDVNMPGKDGFQVLQEIRSDPATEHLPVIILTAARLDPADMQLALNLGADDYVTKPFDRRELLARIRTKLRVKQAEDTVRRRNKELSLLPEIGRELSARTSLTDLADVILRRTVETLGAFMGHLIMLEPQGNSQKTYRIPSEKQENFTPEIPDLAPLLKQVNDTRQGFVIGDTGKDARWPAAMGDPSRSLVVVPIFGRFDLLGLLALAHEQPEYFSQEHMLLLQAIASQAAIAMENARLFTTMKQERQRLNVVLQNTTDAILIFDAEKKMSMANTAAQKLFKGHEIELGKPLQTRFENTLLIGLLDQAQVTDACQSCLIAWSNKQTYNVLVTPVEDGYVATLHETSSRG